MSWERERALSLYTCRHWLTVLSVGIHEMMFNFTLFNSAIPGWRAEDGGTRHVINLAGYTIEMPFLTLPIWLAIPSYHTVLPIIPLGLSCLISEDGFERKRKYGRKRMNEWDVCAFPCMLFACLCHECFPYRVSVMSLLCSKQCQPEFLPLCQWEVPTRQPRWADCPHLVQMTCNTILQTLNCTRISDVHTTLCMLNDFADALYCIGTKMWGAVSGFQNPHICSDPFNDFKSKH